VICLLCFFACTADVEDDEILIETEEEFDMNEWIDSGITYTDSRVTLDRNPGRGRAGYMDSQFWVKCSSDGNTYVAKESDFVTYGIYTPLFQIAAFSSGNDFKQTGSMNASEMPEVVGGTNTDINAQTLEAIEAAFINAQKNGAQCVPRFAYDSNGVIGCEPDDIRWMIRHIEQISAIINKYAGTVISVEASMIGPWGEMHSSKYDARNKDFSNQILDAWLKNLDESITLQVRTPSLILNYLGVTGAQFKEMLPLGKDSPAYRIGMYNDGYMGTGEDYGTFLEPKAKETSNITRATGVEFLKTQNLRIPYGGEFAYVSDLKFLEDYRSVILTDGFIKELYDTHLSYLRNINTNQFIANYLNEIKFDEKYAFDGMPDVEDYYGQTVSKFILDHMGYRYVIRSASNILKANKGGTVEFKGTIENVGFGYCVSEIISELVVVAPNGDVSVGKANVDPRKWESAKINEYDIMMSVPKEAEAGEYKVYLRLGVSEYSKLSAPSIGAIRFANPNVWNNKVGGNYIGSFTDVNK